MSEIKTVSDYIYTPPVDNRDIFNKIVDKILSIVRDIMAILSLLPTQIAKMMGKYPESTSVIPQWKEGSEGLYVLVNGLMSPNSLWGSHIKDLRREDSKCDIYVPEVPHWGNCTLEEAIATIESALNNYIDTHPGKPVVLIGLSNGGRLSLELDRRFRDKEVNMKISTLAAVTYGTKRMTLADQIGVASLLFDKGIKEDLQYESQDMVARLGSIQKPVTKGTRSYDFYATREDLLVTPFNSSIPLLKDSFIQIFTGQGHVSIVEAARKDQIKRCTVWMGENKLKA